MGEIETRALVSSRTPGGEVLFVSCVAFEIDRPTSVLQVCTLAQGGATIYADIGTYLPSRVYLRISVPGRTDRCALVVRSGCSAGLGNFHSLIVPVDYPVPGNVRPCATSFEKTDVLYAIWVSSIVWDTGPLFTLSSFIA